MVSKNLGARCDFRELTILNLYKIKQAGIKKSSKIFIVDNNVKKYIKVRIKIYEWIQLETWTYSSRYKE